MAQTTKKRIMEGFLQLLEQRPLDKISVVDVADHCGINRNTFYYYYCDIYALIRELMELVAQRMIAEGLSDRNWTEIAQQLTAFIREHRRAVTHLFHSSQRDLLEDYIYDVTYAVTESLVRRTAASLPVSEEDLHTVTMYFTSALLGMISRWLRFGLKDGLWTPESRREFAGTLDHSIHQMAAAFELWDFGVWTPVLQATFYAGLFQVGRAVLDGTFRRHKHRKNIKEIEETT